MTIMVLRGIAIFLLLLTATGIMMNNFEMEFGKTDFFQKHGIFFLFFITFFPRLTLLFGNVATGGVLWWLGLIFLPRILVASLATVSYFQTNPFLVVMSWLIAFSGEFFEKMGIGKKRFVFRTYNMGNPSPFDNVPPKGTSLKSDDVIEAEFTKKDV